MSTLRVPRMKTRDDVVWVVFCVVVCEGEAKCVCVRSGFSRTTTLKSDSSHSPPKLLLKGWKSIYRLRVSLHHIKQGIVVQERGVDLDASRRSGARRSARARHASPLTRPLL